MGSSKPELEVSVSSLFKAHGKQRIFSRLSLCLRLIFVGIILKGCASGSQKVNAIVQPQLHEIAISSLHFRRPSGKPVDPQAGPGGVDYRSTKSPDDRWDCQAWKQIEPPAGFFGPAGSGQDTSAALSCAMSFQKDPRFGSQPLEWQLIRAAQPWLALRKNKERDAAFPCLLETLNRIPVPREIVYQALSGKSLECYSTRIPIEADEWLGLKIPGKSSFGLVVSKIPASATLSQDAFMRWWRGLSISPFFATGDGSGVVTRIMVESLCRQCMGAAYLERPSDSLEFFQEPSSLQAEGP